jgi:hypothetical protein
MPTILSDPPSSVYIILGVVGVLCLVAAFFLVGKAPPSKDPKKKQSSPRKYFVSAGVLALLAMVAVFICDRLFESDKEQIVRKINEMSDGVRDRNLDRTFEHVSESFRFGTAGKSQLRSRGDQALQSGQVTEIKIWDVVIESLDIEGGNAVVNVRFKVEGSALQANNQFIGELTFKREANGQWRMTKLKVFPPTGKRDEFPIPGL